MKHLVIFSLLLGILVCNKVCAEPNLSNSLNLQIVPHHTSATGEQQIKINAAAEHFHVVLTNTGSAPINLWQISNSWGYANLSFEIEDQTGNVVQIKKKPRDWNKNFPTWSTLSPSEHMVFDVKLADGTWQNWQQAKLAKTLKLTAIFENEPDKQALANAIWVGKTVSKQGTYTLID